MKIIIFLSLVCSSYAQFTDPLSDFANGVKTGMTMLENTAKSGLRVGKQNPLGLTSRRVPFLKLIENEGYPVESHYLTTTDGYILNIFRIPFGKSGKSLNKVVYLQHGLMAASDDYILFGPKRGLAYILADEGYDVWLGNVRGNVYSRNHTRWNPDTDAEFWQFSWHEIGVVDIPETIDYILLKSGKTKLFHIGHSQGTTSFYVMASMRPEYNAKVQHHISLAPIAFMSNMFSPLIRITSLGTFPLGITMESLGMNEFLPTDSFLSLLASNLCPQGVAQILCKNALFAVCGFSPSQMQNEDIPLLTGNYPAGAATKQIVHYGQEVLSGRFCQFDFGLLKNMDRYKSPITPDYDLSKISAPVTLIYGANDWLASVVDVEKLAKRLPNLKESYLVPIPTWNHLDFEFGKDAPTVVYPKIIKTLSEA